MELSQHYPLDLETKLQHQHYHHQPLRRPLSPQEEKLQLSKKIEQLMTKNSLLKEKLESLQNTISDIRKVLELVGNESMEECSQLHRQRVNLQKKVKTLTKLMELQHRDGNHLSRCSLYWKEFLQ